jgi:hypothetical protein
MLTPEGWDSARFRGSCLASSFPLLADRIRARPLAADASRSAARGHV